MYWLDNLLCSLLLGVLLLLISAGVAFITVMVIDAVRERRSHRKP